MYTCEYMYLHTYIYVFIFMHIYIYIYQPFSLQVGSSAPKSTTSRQVSRLRVWQPRRRTSPRYGDAETSSSQGLCTLSKKELLLGIPIMVILSRSSDLFCILVTWYVTIVQKFFCLISLMFQGSFLEYRGCTEMLECSEDLPTWANYGYGGGSVLGLGKVSHLDLSSFSFLCFVMFFGWDVYSKPQKGTTLEGWGGSVLVYVYICIHLYVYCCVRVYVLVCVKVYVHAKAHVDAYVDICIDLYIYIYTNICIHVYTYIHVCMRRHVYIYIYYEHVFLKVYVYVFL